MSLYNAPKLAKPISCLLKAILSVACIIYSIALATETLVVNLGGKPYQIELAISAAQRRQGLMHRAKLAPNSGLLLVYPNAGDHRVWMKNMLIPLRVYWINEAFEVIDIQRLVPCSSIPCAVYSAAGGAKFILELGDYDHQLKLGDRIDDLTNL